jgi:hypothetical protein
MSNDDRRAEDSFKCHIVSPRNLTRASTTLVHRGNVMTKDLLAMAE